MNSKIKTTLIVFGVLALGTLMYVFRGKIIPESVSKIIEPIIILMMSSITSGSVKKFIAPAITLIIFSIVLFGIIKVYLHFRRSDILKILERKSKLIEENISLLDKPINYGGVEKHLRDLEPIYFMGIRGPRKHMKKIMVNAKKINRINEVLAKETYKLTSVGEKEEKNLIYTLMHSSAIKKTITNLKEIDITAEDITGPISSGEKEDIKEILKLRTRIVKGVTDVKTHLDSEQNTIDSICAILDSLSSKKNKTSLDILQNIKNIHQPNVKTAINEAIKLTNELKVSFEEEKKNIVKILSNIFQERERLNAVMNEIEHSETTLDKAGILVIPSKKPYGSLTTLSMLLVMIKERVRQGIPPEGFTEREKDKIVEFIKNIESGEHLANEIEKGINTYGQQGLEELLKILQAYFKIERK